MKLDMTFNTALVVVAGLTWADAGLACGGLFCDAVQPVVQVDERIIFVDNPDDTVTAVVQIMYQGPSEQFAWVLPVPGVPEVAVSSNIAFTRLQTATDPSYTLERRVEGECGAAIIPLAGCAAQAAPADFGGGGDGLENEDGSIEVLDAGSVGPYDFEVISAASITQEDPAEAALEWLTENGYEASALGGDLIRPYLVDGMNLIAFRLSKNADTGEIRPVALTYSSPTPMIPIKLTAVAAQDDMGVLVWTVAGSRGIPTNYRSLELNDAMINWFSYQSTYFDVINAAADEADGHGFVTELSTDAADMTDVVFGPDDESQWSAIANRSWVGDEVGLLDEVRFTYAGWDGLDVAVREGIDLSDGNGTPQVTAADVLGCPSCHRSRVESMDVPAFINAVRENVIEPVRFAQTLVLSRPNVTRLFTTMSAAEMTEDPIFDFNNDLENVSNVHTAEQIVECNLGVAEFEAPWRVELPSGQVVRGTGSQWPIQPTDDLPKNLRIIQDATTGPGEVIVDNTEDVRLALAQQNRGVTGFGCMGLYRGRVEGLAELAGVFFLVWARAGRFAGGGEPDEAERLHRGSRSQQAQ